METYKSEKGTMYFKHESLLDRESERSEIAYIAHVAYVGIGCIDKIFRYDPTGEFLEF